MSLPKCNTLYVTELVLSKVEGSNEIQSTIFNLFMQNKAKLPNTQMNVSSVYTTNYVKLTLGERGKNKAKTKPNKANLKKAKNERNIIYNRGL